MTLKIYITGAHGFIGSALVEFLSNMNIEVISDTVDITSQHDVLKEVTAVKPDIIIHAAAIVSSVRVHDADWYAFDVNVKGTYNIAKTAKLVNAKLIYCQSSSIYKPTNEIMTESSAIKPTTLYNLTKYLGDFVIDHVLDSKHILNLRLCHIYGYGYKDHCSIISNIIQNAVVKQPTIVLSSPESERSYLFIDDMCHAFLMAIEHNLSGTLNVSSHDYRKLGDIIDFIRDVLYLHGIDPVIVFRKEADYMGSHKVSSDLFRSITGWNEQTTLEAGIKKCISSILSARP